VLKTIIELKGEKRFRRQRGTGSSMVERIGGEDLGSAKQTFRKMNTKSSYNRQFGERPAEEEAYTIVKKKRLSELDFASILKPTACAMIEKWIAGGSEEEFTARVFFTLRAMYTIVRGRSNFSTTNGEFLVDTPKYQGSQPPRFDLFTKNQNATMRLTSTNMALEAKRKHAETMRGIKVPTSM